MNEKKFRFAGSKETMPVFFVGHGSPMNAIEDNEFTRGWSHMGQTFPKPRAVLCISAHWETRGTWLTAMDRPATIHDFSGFPKELYQVQYPAPGDPEMAVNIKKSISKTTCELDARWGLDHGCWSVLKKMFPEADVPVIEMSLDHDKKASDHYELAKELSSLREKGVLIVTSGNLVHNLSLVAWDKLYTDFGFDWALEANEKIKTFIQNGDVKSLMHYESLGRAFHLSIPTPEHFIPLIYALALRNEDEPIEFFNDKLAGGSLSMTSVKIGKS